MAVSVQSRTTEPFTVTARSPTKILSDMKRAPMKGPQVTATAVSNDADEAFILSSAPAYQPRKFKVITIGAGFSGLLMAHKFQHRFPKMRDIIDHKIFEARSDVGGTWLANHYPGVQCDVPAHIYVSDCVAHLP